MKYIDTNIIKMNPRDPTPNIWRRSLCIFYHPLILLSYSSSLERFPKLNLFVIANDKTER